MTQPNKPPSLKVSFRTALKGLDEPVDVQVTFRPKSADSMRSWLAKGSGRDDLHAAIDAACKGMATALTSNRMKKALTRQQ
jgi:hypothetical protein